MANHAKISNSIRFFNNESGAPPPLPPFESGMPPRPQTSNVETRPSTGIGIRSVFNSGSRQVSVERPSTTATGRKSGVYYRVRDFSKNEQRSYATDLLKVLAVSGKRAISILDYLSTESIQR